MQLKQLIQRSANQLHTISRTPRLDVEILWAHVLGVSRSQLWVKADDLINADIHSQFLRLLMRRTLGEPVSYLTGKKSFWSFELIVTSDVLVPRPETECLIETVLEILPKNRFQWITDLGVGSGAIALTLAKERPNWRIIGVDASQAALRVAKQNASQLGVNNIEWIHSDWFGHLYGCRFHAIISNPPYVEGSAINSSLAFEPAQALFSGEDGLDDIRCIIANAPDYLFTGGQLFLEHGYQQQRIIKILMEDAGYKDIQGYTDLAGLDRWVVGTIR